MDTLVFGPDVFLSAFTARYGSAEMRSLWSMLYHAQLRRQVWVAHGDSLHAAGVISGEQAADLHANESVDVEVLARILEHEGELGHDVMAAILAFQEDALVGGPVIHLGMTSEDSTSNVDMIIMRAAFALLIHRIEELIPLFVDRVDSEADHLCMGYTHLRSAVTTTVGYRIARYLQDLMMDLEMMRNVYGALRGKGLKGAVGTRASFTELLDGQPMTAEALENHFMDALGLDAYPITGQTYPRKVDLWVLAALSSLAQSLHKFAWDVRIQQSSPFSELQEPFKERQVGSSAMPWKKNPVHSENLCSLARAVPPMLQTLWMNAAFDGLDRTLDDSGNRRLVLPTAFLTMDEVLKRARIIISGLIVKDRVIQRNLDTYGLFAGSEALLMRLVRDHGQDRTEAHELIRTASMKAWKGVEQTGVNVLPRILATRLSGRVELDESEILAILREGSSNVGDAPERARALALEARTLAQPVELT